MEVFVIFWLICGGVAAVIASSKGGSALLGFAAGALLGPLGLIAAFFLGSEAGQADRQVRSGDKKKCPRCAELVQPDAKVCRYCGHEFAEEERKAIPAPIAVAPAPPTLTPEEADARTAQTRRDSILLFVGIGLLIAALLVFASLQQRRTSEKMNAETKSAIIESDKAQRRLQDDLDQLNAQIAADDARQP